MPNPTSDITPPRCTQNRFLYIFLDEAGDFNFSPNGTRYFTLSSIAKERPFHAYKELIELKYDLIESGTSIEYFHASEDKQTTRDRVFKIIQSNLTGIRVDSLIVEKRKTAPALRAEERFYPEMLGYLLRHVIKHHNLSQYSEVIVFTDRIPVQRKRHTVEKAVKVTLAKMLRTGVRYRVLHHDSKSNCDLQIADYSNWAIYRKWTRTIAAPTHLSRQLSEASLIFFAMAPHSTTKTTTPATLAREPPGLFSPGWDL